ncbi:MAG: hypothetical protein APF80_11975 [Alphaproteobacteria bacterium BRH_c36]|nr:MAG: hypothetical protein APF80_11975 [Alphaproteobacteria bacterium BRH_c36]
MNDDVEYLANYKADTLYIHPAAGNKGAYASLLAENEVMIGEIEVTGRSRLAVSAFFVNEKENYGTLKLTKLQYHKTHGWRLDGQITMNPFLVDRMQEFVSLLASLNFKDASKNKISLNGANLDVVDAIMRMERGADVLRTIAESPALSEDIFALAHKKGELEVFRKLLNDDSFKSEYAERHELKAAGAEGVWQHFFEQNPWIFGHGLNYVFLDKIGDKLETVTTGFSHEQPGKRVDALMRTRAVISQYVLIEIKTPTAPLLKAREYRSGCWSLHEGVSEAVTQIQKTTFDFTSNQFHKVQMKEGGRLTGQEVFRIQPKSYLVIGNLAELQGQDDKFTCFQLYRNSLTSPEIITFDELYERAKCIVETISHKQKAST